MGRLSSPAEGDDIEPLGISFSCKLRGIEGLSASFLYIFSFTRIFILIRKKYIYIRETEAYPIIPRNLWKNERP